MVKSCDSETVAMHGCHVLCCLPFTELFTLPLFSLSTKHVTVYLTSSTERELFTLFASCLPKFSLSATLLCPPNSSLSALFNNLVTLCPPNLSLLPRPDQYHNFNIIISQHRWSYILQGILRKQQQQKKFNIRPPIFTTRRYDKCTYMLIYFITKLCTPLQFLPGNYKWEIYPTWQLHSATAKISYSVTVFKLIQLPLVVLTVT